MKTFTIYKQELLVTFELLMIRLVVVSGKQIKKGVLR